MKELNFLFIFFVLGMTSTGCVDGFKSSIQSPSTLGPGQVGDDILTDPPGNVSPMADDYIPTHYVAPNGVASWGEAVNSNTPASAATAFANAEAGDIVQFGPGIYTGRGVNDPNAGIFPAFNVQNSGAPGNSIVFYAQYPAVTANIADRSKLKDLNSPADPIEAVNPVLTMNNHVVLDGFWFDDADGGKPHARGTVYSGYAKTNQVYRRLRFDRRPADIYYKANEPRRNDNYNCIHFHGSSNVTVVDNIFVGGAITQNEPFSGVGPNRNWAAITTYGTRNFQIEHNHFQNMENGIFVKGGDSIYGNYGVIRFNRFVQMQRTISLGMKTGADEIQAGVLAPPTQVYQNLFYWTQNMYHPNFGMEFDNSVGPRNEYTWFYNNTIYTQQRLLDGLVLSQNGNSHVGSIFRNNIVASAAGAQQNVFINFFEENAPTVMNEFDYNLYYNGGEALQFSFGQSIFDGIDAWKQALIGVGNDGSGKAIDSNSIVANPMFVDVNNSDFRLLPGSQALTASNIGGPVGAYISGVEHIGVRYINY